MKIGVTVIDHKEEFYKYLEKVVSSSFIKNIQIFEKQKKIELMPEKIDFDEEAGTWCGTLYLKINKGKVTTEELVNCIIGMAGADEISIKGDALRLWWD